MTHHLSFKISKYPLDIPHINTVPERDYWRIVIFATNLGSHADRACETEHRIRYVSSRRKAPEAGNAEVGPGLTKLK